MTERVTAANRFVQDCNFQGEVVCDSMANEIVDRFDAHPERILIIDKGVVVHKGGKGPLIFYDIEDVIEWLHKHDHRPSSAVPAKQTAESQCSS